MRLWIFTIVIYLALITTAHGMEVTLRWDANTETNLGGYKVYYKTGSSGPPYQSPITMTLAQDENPDPNIVEFTVQGLVAYTKYYFVVTAYNNADPSLESDYSNEVSLPYPSKPKNLRGE
jgi:hypothetical protein